MLKGLQKIFIKNTYETVVRFYPQLPTSLYFKNEKN